MLETNWFQEEEVDPAPPRTHRLGWLLFVAIAVSLIAIPIYLAAAIPPQPFTGVCGLKPIGEDEQGIKYVAYSCLPK